MFFHHLQMQQILHILMSHSNFYLSLWNNEGKKRKEKYRKNTDEKRQEEKIEERMIKDEMENRKSENTIN